MIEFLESAPTGPQRFDLPGATVWMSGHAKGRDKMSVAREAAAPAATNWRGDRGVIADRLKILFPDAKIIVAIRNQLSMLHSQYVNRNAKSVYYRPLDKWLHDLFEDWQRGYAFEFQYDRLIDVYRSRFGERNIHVMLFEEFVHDRDLFTDDLATFLGIPTAAFREKNTQDRITNPTKSARSLQYARFRNRFLPNVPLSRLVPHYGTEAIHRFIQGGDRARIEFSTDWQQRITDYYAEGNAKLCDIVGESRLRRYQYPLPR